MCGIAGIIGNHVPDADARLARMSNALRHRGPDDAGIHVWPATEHHVYAAFAHRRLSIIDLSAAGHQPMFTPDGRYSIIFNGEIYNYRTLRRELETEGVSFTSNSDTEVLLQLYALRGADCLRWLRGMFAFAVRNNQTGEVFIARDPLGIKPVYYHLSENQFAFASELRALLASGLLPRRLSPAGLVSFLKTGSVSGPGTIIRDVRLLPPGHFVRVNQNGYRSLEVKESAYTGDWLANGKGLAGLSRAAAVEALREGLKESVRIHLESDVPLGPFLSGGMDSSAIVALMSAVTKQKPRTFSVVFDEEKLSEAQHARLVATKFGTEHHEILLGQEQLFEMLPAAVAAEDQPTMDGINTFVVSKAVKEAGITVALSGLGGDELFAGYPTFRRAVHLQSLARVPGSVRGGISAVGQRVWNRSRQQDKLWQFLRSDGTARAACSVSRQLLTNDEVGSLVSENGVFVKESNANGHAPILGDDTINAVSFWELSGYMANTLLRDTDSMSMAHSLEVRVPFLDVEVVRFVLGLPGNWKLNGKRQKPLLQDALGDLLPSEIMNRPKMGFALPFQYWMQSRLRDEIETTFRDDKQFESIGLRPERVREVWRQFLRRPESMGWSRPWALYVLSRWCQQHGVTL